jgi:hypothetical protein
MASLKKILKRFGWATPLSLIVFLALFTPLTSYAFSWTDLPYSILAQIAFGVSWLMALVAGFLVSFEAYIVQFVLGLSFQIASSKIVATGFPIMLSIANLAFVLGLIVVAIATILRLQSYGLKQVLWKLLVVAVVVNFGLIIAGTILQFSDNITLFMVKSIVPTQGNTVGDSTSNLSEFASIMAGAFNPQVGFLQSASSLKNPIEAATLNQSFNVAGGDFGAMLAPIVGVSLTFAQLCIILIVLGAFAVILLMRYIKLAFALITLPLAWAAWPFPAFKSHATKWWSEFLKQAFYPIPIIFFLWLGLIVAQSLHNSTSNYFPTPTTGANTGPLGAVTAFLGDFLSPIAMNFVSIIVIAGVMIMGLFAAEKMGASFAKNAHHAITEGGKAAKKRMSAWAGNRASQAGARLNIAQKNARAGLLERIPGQKQSKVLVDKEGNAIMREAGRDIWGNVGVKKNILVDGRGKKYTSFSKDVDGEYIDATGNRINGATIQQAYVTEDGKILNEQRLRDKRNVAVTKDGRVVAGTQTVVEDGLSRIELTNKNVLDAQGKLKGGYIDSNGEVAKASTATRLRQEAQRSEAHLANLRKEGEDAKGQAAKSFFSNLFSTPGAFVGGFIHGLGSPEVKFSAKELKTMAETAEEGAKPATGGATPPAEAHS